MREIIIDITNDGEVKIETRGYSGKGCIADSQFIKDLLGKETEKQLTPAYYKENNQKIKKYLPLCG